MPFLWKAAHNILLLLLVWGSYYTYRNTSISVYGQKHTVYHGYPTFRSEPKTFVDEQQNTFAITGVSVEDNSNSLWWKWFMPSFYEDNLKGLNLTVSDTHMPGYLCHVRMIGVSSSKHSFLVPGGKGYITALSDVYHVEGLKCYYMLFAVNLEYDRVSVYCPVWVNSTRQGTTFNSSPVSSHKICHTFRKSFSATIMLLPASHKSDAKAEVSTAAYSKFIAHRKNKTDAGGNRLVLLREAERSRFSMPNTTLKNSRNTLPPWNKVVFTAQVFRNRMTGPYMGMFIKHYGELRFTIVIFDRFGMHFDVVKEYLSVYDIRYHPYTALQLASPDIYTYEYAATLPKHFLNFYVREKLNSEKTMDGVVNDTALLDLDKQLTFDSARLEFRLSPVVLPKRHQCENWMFARLNLAGTTATNTLGFKREVDGDVIARIENCIVKAYEDNRNYVEMSKCYSGPTTNQKFPKFADAMGVCPFSWNHGSCMSYNPKDGPWTADKVAQKYYRQKQPWCFCRRQKISNSRLALLHLSHTAYMTNMFREKLFDTVFNQTENPLAQTFRSPFQYNTMRVSSSLKIASSKGKTLVPGYYPTTQNSKESLAEH